MDSHSQEGINSPRTCEKVRNCFEAKNLKLIFYSPNLTQQKTNQVNNLLYLAKAAPDQQGYKSQLSLMR